MESMMTVRQVAELLGVHENWVYDQAANGELPSYKIGGTRRFDPDELRGWIAEHREAERRPRRQQPAAGRENARAGRRRRAAQPEERRPPSTPPVRAGNRNGGKTADGGDQAQPRLFET